MVFSFSLQSSLYFPRFPCVLFWKESIMDSRVSLEKSFMMMTHTVG